MLFFTFKIHMQVVKLYSNEFTVYILHLCSYKFSVMEHTSKIH